MEITIGEAANALSVNPGSIASWYLQKRSNKMPLHFGLDSEVLCENIGLDHRFLMAFLVGYDIALSSPQVQAMTGKNVTWVQRNGQPVFSISDCLGRRSLVRYSYRRVAPIRAALLEEKNGNHRTTTHGGGSLLPAPDLMPPDTWTFRSALTTEGTRLPWSRRSILANGRESSLPILDSNYSEEG